MLIISGQTPLHVAITEGSEETVRKLVLAGAPVNVPDKNVAAKLFFKLILIGEYSTPLGLLCAFIATDNQAHAR